MLKQGLIVIDKYSDLCIDGKPCDMLGDLIYEANGQRIKERDFKEYRRFTPQFRQHLIMKYFRDNEINLTGVSCSCSKCGTIASDESLWI